MAKQRSLFERLLGPSDGGHPLDFTKLACHEIDVDEVVDSLQIHEKASSNGGEELPSSSASQLDGPQRSIEAYFKGRIGEILSTYEQRLQGLNQKIESRDIHLKVEASERMEQELQNELRHLKQQEEIRLDRARMDYVNFLEEYTSFKSGMGIDREPDYPDSRGVQWALVVLACLLEASVNAFFYYQGLETGIAGGTILALILAVVDISILFFVGRGAARVVSRRIDHRISGVLLFIVFIVWAVGYNLGTAHIREQLQGDVLIQTASRLALISFQSQPFGLEQADSWVLFIFGFFFSVMAFMSGYAWDEKIPGYGKKHRQLMLRRDEYDHLVVEHREKAAQVLKQRRKKLERLLKDAKSNLDLLKHDVKTKETLLRVVKECIAQNMRACETVIQIYRDENQKARSTLPPPYFDDPIDISVTYPERFDPSEDQARVARYEARLESVMLNINLRQSRLDEVYQRYIEGLNLSSSKDLREEIGAPDLPAPQDHE